MQLNKQQYAGSAECASRSLPFGQPRRGPGYTYSPVQAVEPPPRLHCRRRPPSAHGELCDLHRRSRKQRATNVRRAGEMPAAHFSFGRPCADERRRKAIGQIAVESSLSILVEPIPSSAKSNLPAAAFLSYTIQKRQRRGLWHIAFPVAENPGSSRSAGAFSLAAVPASFTRRTSGERVFSYYAKESDNV